MERDFFFHPQQIPQSQSGTGPLLMRYACVNVLREHIHGCYVICEVFSNFSIIKYQQQPFMQYAICDINQALSPSLHIET